LLVTGPGPVVIPNCKVKFIDQAGSAYEKTSDSNGYIYLQQSELPDYAAGDPSVTDISARTKPVSFSFGSTTITDQAKIAKTCGVPYKVGLEISMTGSSWERTVVTADYVLKRMVEGVEESSWGGLTFPEGNPSTGLGYFYYRVKGDVSTFISNGAFQKGLSLDKMYAGDHFVVITNPLKDYGDYSSSTVRDGFVTWERDLGTVQSSRAEKATWGDGSEPQVVDVHYVMLGNKNAAYSWDRYYQYFPDYGLSVQSEEMTIIPEYCTMGALDVSGLKDTDPYLSYNGKPVSDPDAGDAPVRVSLTNYELVLGKTSFCFDFDWSSFGHVYLKGSEYDSSEKVFRFERFDSLKEYLEEYVRDRAPYSGTFEYGVSTFRNSGMLGDVKVDNNVRVTPVLDADKGTMYLKEPCLIRNVYDGFNLMFTDWELWDIFYGGAEGTFSYEEGAYVAGCTLEGNAYSFQAIVDGKSKEY